MKVNNRLFLSVSLDAADGEIVGYKAKKHRDMIDLEKIDHYSITDFWDPIRNGSDDHLILEPEAFYIFASKERCRIPVHLDRKSTRLNSSHVAISYAVFCLKK